MHYIYVLLIVAPVDIFNHRPSVLISALGVALKIPLKRMISINRITIPFKICTPLITSASRGECAKLAAKTSLSLSPTRTMRTHIGGLRCLFLVYVLFLNLIFLARGGSPQSMSCS